MNLIAVVIFVIGLFAKQKIRPIALRTTKPELHKLYVFRFRYMNDNLF